MSEQVLVGRDPQGRPVYAEVLSSEEIVEKLKATEEWQDFKNKFDMSKDSNNTLLGMVFDEKLGDDPSVEDYQRLIKTLFRAGGVVLINGTQYEFELKEYEPEPIPEPQVPRDRNGKPLSQSQIAWGEMARWSERASSQEIKERRRTDPAFASFYRLNIEREARETPSTQFELAGQSPTQTKQATPELIAFAEEYRKTPVEKVRQLRSPAFNPLGYKKYIENIETALAAGLI